MRPGHDAMRRQRYDTNPAVRLDNRHVAAAGVPACGVTVTGHLCEATR
jgi:hypothetical protein